MRFLADMGVGRRVMTWLRSQNHDAVHVREIGWQRAEDVDIFAQAATDRRIVLTFDLDFGEIASHSQKPAPSIILFRLQIERATHVIARLQKVLDEASDALAAGAIIIVEDSRYRVRRLPFR